MPNNFTDTITAIKTDSQTIRQIVFDRIRFARPAQRFDENEFKRMIRFYVKLRNNLAEHPDAIKKFVELDLSDSETDNFSRILSDAQREIIDLRNRENLLSAVFSPDLKKLLVELQLSQIRLINREKLLTPCLLKQRID